MGIIAQYGNLENMLMKAALYTDNLLIRNEVIRKMKEIMLVKIGPYVKPELISIVEIYLAKVLPAAD